MILSKFLSAPSQVLERLTRPRLNVKTRAQFYELLMVLINNGVPVAVAMNELHDIWSDGGAHPKNPLARITKYCYASLASGKSLAVALASWIPPQEVALIAAGERAGNVGVAFADAIELADTKSQIRGAIVGAVVYPTFLLIMLGGMLGIISLMLVPKLSQMIPPEQWTGFAYLLLLLSKTASIPGLVTVGFLVVSVVGVFFSLPRLVKGRTILDRLPIYSSYRLIQGSTFLLNTGVMLRAGIPLIAAMEQQMAFAAPWLLERLETTLYGIRMGKNLGVALKNTGYDFPDKTSVRIISALASRDGFDQSLDRYSRRMMETTQRSLKTKAAISFALALISIGAVMAILVLGTMTLKNAVTSGI